MGWNKLAQARQGDGARNSPRASFVPPPESSLVLAEGAWHQAGDATSKLHYNFMEAPGVLPWNNQSRGDWVDESNELNGGDPYYTPQWGAGSSDAGKGFPFERAFNYTTLIQEQLAGGDGDGIYLKAHSGSSTYTIATRFHPLYAPPTLTIEWPIAADSVLEAVHVCPIKTSTDFRLGNDATALLDVGLGHVLMRFDLTGLPAEVPDNAEVVVNVVGHFDSDNLTMHVYKTVPKVQRSIPVEQGFAAGYTADSGIAADLDCIDYVDFGAGNGAPRWKSKGSQYEFWNVDTPNSQARLTIYAGTNVGSSMYFSFGLQDPPMTEPTELWMRYYVKLDATTWSGIASGGKFPGFGGQDADGEAQGGNGGDNTTGSNGWSARGQYSHSVSVNNPMAGKTALGSYVYHIDDADDFPNSGFGEIRWWADETNHEAILDVDTWYCIEQHIRLNTYADDVGVKDGILEAWVDGKLCFRRTNYRWVSDANHPIAWVWFNLYHGGSTNAVADHDMYIRDIVIGSAYIGPQGV